MLTFSLVAAVFSSLVWLAYALRFVIDSLSGMSFFDAGILNVLLYVLFVALPILLIWIIFAFVNQYVYNRSISRQMFRLFGQMKKNQEYSDLLARIMLETEQNIKNSFALNRFDLLIADMNELLSEFLIRERLSSIDQIEHLWTKVQNGGKWSFGKVVIENYNQQPNFQRKILDDAMVDTLLAGTIMEFCARYQTLLGLLEKHDKERVLLNIIETGVFGKVFAILAPIADQARRKRENAQIIKEETLIDEEINAPEVKAPMQEAVKAYKAEKPVIKERVNQFFSKITSFAAKEATEPQTPTAKDPFSLALERSFGSQTEAPEKREEPVFDNDAYSLGEEKKPEIFTESVVENLSETKNDDVGFAGTQNTLASLRKEWQAMSSPEAQKKSDDTDNLTYPFSSWTDVENYKK